MSKSLPVGAIASLEITVRNNRLIVRGAPGNENHQHSCDLMGCPSVGPHILADYDAGPILAQLFDEA